MTVNERARQIRHLLDDTSLWPNPRLARSSPDYSLVDVNPDGSGAVYLGGVRALDDLRFMSRVGGVVSIIDPERFPFSALKPKYGARPYLYLPLDDDEREDIAQYFNEAYRFIKHFQERGVPVFIHCVAGKSRSTSLVTYFLMRKYGITAIQALDVLKRRRPIVRPNDGFLKQLVQREPAAVVIN